MLPPPLPPPAVTRRRAVLAGALLGAGAVAGLDQVVFHQLLAWHQLLDPAAPTVQRVWEAVLHAASLVAVVGAAAWSVVLARRPGWTRTGWVGGALVGGGAFQLYDGLVQHALLDLHQVRDVADLLPYDLAWNLAGAALVTAGLLLVRRARLT